MGIQQAAYNQSIRTDLKGEVNTTASLESCRGCWLLEHGEEIVRKIMVKKYQLVHCPSRYKKEALKTINKLQSSK